MKRKKGHIKILSIIFVIIWCIIVFCLSAEVADDSSKTSGNTIKLALRIINPKIDSITLDKMVLIMQPIVRKMAHFTLYAIGGVLLFNMLDNFTTLRFKNVVISWTSGLVYAITDEIHQLFVAGRSGELRDVCIDSLGVLCGICVIFLITLLYEEHNKKKEK